MNGSTRRKEQAPEGLIDENVFDIEQGVSITLFVKRRGLEKVINHADLWGRRLNKYKIVANAQLRNVNWQPARPVSPFYFFKSRSIGTDEDAYNAFHELREIMPTSVTGL